MHERERTSAVDAEYRTAAMGAAVLQGSEEGAIRLQQPPTGVYASPGFVLNDLRIVKFAPLASMR